MLAGGAMSLVLLVAGVWIVPGLLDWGRYREGIAGLAASGIGRPVRITGAVSLHLLPEPILTAAGIAIDDDGDGVVLTARELRLRVALGPLLAGRVDARDLVLRGADLRLPWPPAPGALGQRPPTWLSGLQARVEDSRIQVGGLAVTGIDAGLATDPDTGTLSTSGVGQAGGGGWRFTARLARPGRDGAAGLDVSLDGQGKLQDTGGTFSGTLAADGSLSGRVAGRGPDLSQLVPAPAVAWRGDGRLSAAGGLAVADELSLSIGGSPARGAVALRVAPDARLDLSLAAGRLDLDAWLPVLARGADAAVPTGIDLSAEAATLAGGTLRRVRGGFDLDRDGVTLRDGQALLPGDAQLTLSGRLPRASPAGFGGMARLTAPDLRATLDWLAPLFPAALAPSGLAPGVLRTADLTAKVEAGAGQGSLSDLAGTLDGSPLTGRLGVKLGPRLGLGAELSFDRLALDPWLPDPAVVAAPDGMAAALARAAGVDADLRLQVRQATLRGEPMGQLALDVQTEAARITLRRLEASPLGARLTASGMVGEGGRVSEGSLEVSAADLAPFRRLLPAGFPLAPLARGPGSLSLSLAGPPDALAARLLLEVGGIRLEAKPVLALAARRWDGPVTLHHPGAPRLLEVLGMPGTLPWLGDGSMSLLAQVQAVPGRITLERFDLVAASLRAGGQLVVEGRSVTGQVAAEVLPLPLPYPRGRDPLPFWALHGWEAALKVEAAEVLLGQAPALQALSADVVVRDGVLRLPRVTAGLMGGVLSGTALVDAAADPPRLAVAAQVSGAAVAGRVLDGPIDLSSGAVDGRLDLAAAGHSPAALLATMSGTAGLDVQDGTLAGLDLAAAAAALADPGQGGLTAKIRAALLGGTTAFSKLELPMRVQRGVVALAGSVTAVSGSIEVAGAVDLLGAADLRLLLRLAAPDPQPGPELGLLLTGPLGATRTPELAGLSRWLAERP